MERRSVPVPAFDWYASQYKAEPALEKGIDVKIGKEQQVNVL